MSIALGLSNVHLAVSDVERAVRFYVEVFGLEERYRADNGVVYLRIPGSTDHLAIEHDSDVDDRVNRFGFLVSDLLTPNPSSDRSCPSAAPSCSAGGWLQASSR